MIGIALAFIAVAVFLIMSALPMTKDQLIALAINAGFSVEDANVAAAIALAESSGKAHAYNPETAAGNPQGQGSFGLWQINLHAHQEFFNQPLYDPQTNANAAFKVFQEQGFSAWSTYTNGAYQEYL